jgi:ribonuclease HI
LTTTVTELLLPKLELGLLYAYGITEQMCNKWTNTIIQTIVQDAHMGKMTTRFLSKDAFTSLTGIPRLWERLKTLRITESFVAINSKNCSNGSSTVARLCALKKKRADQLPLVIEDFQKAATIRGRRYNRLGSVVKWLKETNLVLTNKPEDKTDILSQVKNLQGVLHPLQTQKLKIFTDGSTQMKGRKSENSGFGIVVLDEKNQTLYKEGGIVRSDGNNFIPEIAAAAIVLNALPNHLYADIFIDSQATIAAIKEKPLSERRRIRSAGRAWKTFIRNGKVRLNRSKSTT